MEMMKSDKQVVLQIKNIRKDFGQRTVLKDVNFNVHKGEVVSIIGSSGSGKSTLLRCINLLEKPTSGEIIFHDKDVVKNSLVLLCSGLSKIISGLLSSTITPWSINTTLVDTS